MQRSHGQAAKRGSKNEVKREKPGWKKGGGADCVKRTEREGTSQKKTVGRQADRLLLGYHHPPWVVSQGWGLPLPFG